MRFNRERNIDNAEFRLEFAEFRAATLWEKTCLTFNTDENDVDER